jgi:hypothetical protein
MVPTMMVRNPTTAASDSSVSSDDSHSGNKTEFLSRASKMFTRGVNLLNINALSDDDGDETSPARNGLQERFMEAKQSNLFDGRGSNIFSEASGVEEESLSDASTFDMPKIMNGGGSCDNTGGDRDDQDQEGDIDRLQIEIQAPCTTNQEDFARAMSGMTLNSLASDDSSKRQVREGAGDRSLLSVPLPFFSKSLIGLGGKRNGNDDSMIKTDGTRSNGDRIKGSSWISTQMDFNSSDDAATRRKSANWFLTPSIKLSLEKEEPNLENLAKAQEKSRAAAKLMHKHFQTANNPESFRELQKQMKEKGAFTGSSVRAFLHNKELESSSFCDEDGMELDLDLNQSAKDNFFRASDSKPTSRQASENAFQDSSSSSETKQKELRERLESDPLFGHADPRPYIHLPSREPSLQFLVNVILCSTDEGKTSLLTLHGGKYLGKSKLIHSVIKSVQDQSQNSFTVLHSERSVNTTMVSFFPFRQIVSSALRECDERTKRGAEQSTDDDVDRNASNESDSNIDLVQRLIKRKVLDKSDQLMLSRILPDVMLESRDLLSLLEGRSPMAITQDTAATIFKLFIPLQPVLLVFDAVDGDGQQDSSSWDLLEQLILSSPTSCPQMIPILISRQPLAIPKSLVHLQVVTSLSVIDKNDSKKFICALFDPECKDRHMAVDSHILDVIHARANGCPLFLERLVLWAQRRGIIEIDETRNAVAINSSNGGRSQLMDVLPMTLYEEVLAEINNLSHNELDSLKFACCMGRFYHLCTRQNTSFNTHLLMSSIGMVFSPTIYEALHSEGLFDVLHSLIKSHRMFYVDQDLCYKWRHSVVFDAVSSIIITDERQEIHERICDSFSQSASTACDVQRARHYSITHRLNEAWDVYMDAGKQSEKVFDYTHVSLALPFVSSSALAAN